MDRDTMSIYFLLLFPFSSVVAQEFIWVSDYVVNRTNFFDGSPSFKIPVIEDEQEEVQCRVIADKDENYNVSLSHDGINANVINDIHKTVGTIGEKKAFAVTKSVKFNVDNPAEIDNKNIKCFANRMASALELIVFVRDLISQCDPCHGTEPISLSRLDNQNTEDDVLQALVKKIKEKLGYSDDEITLKPNWTVCGCKKSSNPNPLKMIFGFFGCIVLIFGSSQMCYLVIPLNKDDPGPGTGDVEDQRSERSPFIQPTEGANALPPVSAVERSGEAASQPTEDPGRDEAKTSSIYPSASRSARRRAKKQGK